MAIQITAFMKDTGDFDDAIFTLERNVVGPRAFDHDLGTLPGALSLRIGFDIEESLPDQGLVPESRTHAEFLEASLEDCCDVAAGETGYME
ncbi:MAG: hypothetical protein ABJF23_26420 [Bryobacteraceae bacterium]